MYCVLAKKTDQDKNQSNVLPSAGSSYQDNRMQFVFGETHLKAKKDFMEERIRQTLKITQYFSNNFTDIPVLLGGDFNEEPQNKPISDIMESSFVDLYTLKMIQEKTLKKNQIENYPAFTTFKFRNETGYQKRTIDYMFLCENNFPQSQVTVEALIDPMDLQDDKQLNEEIANPCSDHPSDHYSLAYQVSFRYD